VIGRRGFLPRPTDAAVLTLAGECPNEQIADCGMTTGRRREVSGGIEMIEQVIHQ
jgi:hypothetical protein